MVSISLLAFMTAPFRASLAAPTINCTQGFDFGAFLPLCNGQITVKATAGNGTVNNGCHSLVSGAIQPAICNIQTTLGVATKDARITFTTASHSFDNTGGMGDITIDNLAIQTAGGSQLNSHTFAASLLNPTHTFKVGGRLSFSNNEPKGKYQSSINIVVTSIP